MEEYIGKVRICYQDETTTEMTETEKMMYDIAKDVPEENYNSVLFGNKNGEMIHHLTQERSNVISWMHVGKEDSVLEIGASYGTITSALAKMAGSVDCIEPSLHAARINANRNREKDGITIYCDESVHALNTNEKKYDYIFLIGVFEVVLAEAGMGASDYLKLLNEHLTERGKIVLAVQNKYGLKYWAGHKESHTGEFFAGMNGLEEQKGYLTFSYDSLKSLMDQSGYHQYEFYYPYPDHEFTESIYSDAYLPIPGSLSKEDNNFIYDRMDLFDEQRVFDTLINDHKFVEFSNSYLLLIEGECNG